MFAKSSKLFFLTFPFAVTKIIKSFFNYEFDLTVYGENGYNLVKKKFTWDKIAVKTLNLYNWLLKKEPIPDFIKLD